MDIYSFITKTDKLEMKAMYDWKNLYIVDFSMYPHQVGCIVQYDTANEEQFGIPDPQYKLKKKILQESGWDLIEVKYEEFKKDPKKTATFITEELKKVVPILTSRN